MGVAAASAGDVDYNQIGGGYARRRRTDPRIAAFILDGLGPAATAATVLNVGAGAGSYEPTDRAVIAVEPSPAMLAQRTGHHSPAIRAVADALPLGDDAVDASMATVTVHQWPDVRAGLAELRRVTVGPIVILTFDPDRLQRLWLVEYSPELYRAEASRYPAIGTLVDALGSDTEVRTVPVPLDCVDGFSEAFYGRPEAFLDPAVRRSQSAWSFVDDRDQTRAMDALAADLASGAWDRRFGALRTQPQFEGALTLLVGRPPVPGLREHHPHGER